MKKYKNRIFFILEDDMCLECEEILNGLENIDDEVDALDITFVKVLRQHILYKVYAQIIRWKMWDMPKNLALLNFRD